MRNIICITLYCTTLDVEQNAKPLGNDLPSGALHISGVLWLAYSFHMISAKSGGGNTTWIAVQQNSKQYSQWCDHSIVGLWCDSIHDECSCVILHSACLEGWRVQLWENAIWCGIKDILILTIQAA